MTAHGTTGVLSVARPDAAAVAAAIRAELRHRADPAGPPAVSWFQLAADLEVADANAPVGRTLPELPRFRGVRRVVALLIVKGILYLSRAITNRQRQFNISVLSYLRGLAARLRRLEEEQARLATILADQGARLHELEAALASRATEGRRAG